MTSGGPVSIEPRTGRDRYGLSVGDRAPVANHQSTDPSSAAGIRAIKEGRPSASRARCDVRAGGGTNLDIT
jgi:hypothetical protein